MKSEYSGSLIAAILTLSSMSIEAAGFQRLQVKDWGYQDLTVGLWYPSEQASPSEPNTEFGLSVALDAPIAPTNRGLILISHGYGGWYAGHADTAAALADQGFLVAAPTHTGNTWSDMSSSIDQWSVDRPRHISRVIDHLLNDAHLQTTFDANKIGVYGFSAGGYTALGLIGAVPDFQQAKRHCRQHPEEFVCAEGMIDSMMSADMHLLPAKAWGADKRISAAAISAPGLGFAYSANSLANVEAAVQLWSGQLDQRVPTDTNASLIARNLPLVADTHWVDGATHFAFMTVNCREAFKQAEPEEYEMVCGDADGFDRYDFNQQMQIRMGQFFEDSLEIAR